MDEAICSLTGRPCLCAIGKGCGRGRVDPHADEALQWTRDTAERLDGARRACRHALAALKWSRRHPAPELRAIESAIDDLIEDINNLQK